MKSLLSALKRSGGSSKKTGSKSRVFFQGDENSNDKENNASPVQLAPRRLLAATPEQAKGVRPNGVVPSQVTATPRVLAVEREKEKAPPAPGLATAPRVQRDTREPAPRQTVQKTVAAPRAGSAECTPTLARTSRFAPEPRGGTALHTKFDVAQDVAAAVQAAPPATAGGDDNIKVVVRVRPANERERSLGGSCCVQPLSATTLRVASNPEPHSFAFDHVAQQEASQEAIFRAAGKHIVENCLRGFNGTIFTYGQTGSGKTFTMLGGDDAGSLDESRGLIPRVFEHLFQRIREKQEGVLEGESCKYMVRCSFLEIYNEQLTDLLNPWGTTLAIREDIRKGVYVEGLHEEACSGVEDVSALLQTGTANRRVGETNMNEKSSRSHCVFTCTLESKTVDASGATNILFSRLHLVDLAGSERQKASGAQGERLREAASINKSLSTLGHVISSLVDMQTGKARHIPYRDSRLTFLLQDSLGGNAKTCLIATISPATINMAETLSTLRFADSAKRIKNKAVVNEDTTGESAALRREIKRLREELARAQSAAQQGGAGVGAPVAEGFGSPMRFPMLAGTVSGSPLQLGSPGGSGSSQQGTRRALLAALRRENAASKEVARLERELAEVQELLRAKDGDAQRAVMMLKLRDARLARSQSGMDTADERVAELQQEVELLRAKIEAHPEVKRFAVENLRLYQEVERLQGLVERNEVRALLEEIGGLRGEMLGMAEDLERAQEEAVVQQALAESLKVDSDFAAEKMRSQANADMDQAVSQLKDQLASERRQLEEANASNAQLLQQVAALQLTVAQLEGTTESLRSELSPVRRRAQQAQQQLDLVRQESSVALQQATSVATLHSQAEQQLQQHVAELEQALEQTKAEAEGAKEALSQQLASLKVECNNLKAQLEQEHAAAAERQSDHKDAMQHIYKMRVRIGALEGSVASLQQELLDSQEALARQKDEHEAAQSAAAENIAAALQGAQEMQAALEGRDARVGELEREVGALTQQLHQLEHAKKHAEMQLAQRDNELQDVGQSVEDLEATVAKQRVELGKATEEVEQLKAGIASREEAAAAAAAQVAALTAQLAEASSARNPEQEAQLLLARAEVKDLRALIAEGERTLEGLKAQVASREEELAELRGQMAAEVHAAAQQVQQLLAAHVEVEALRANLAASEAAAAEAEALRQRLEAAEAALQQLKSSGDAEMEAVRAMASQAQAASEAAAEEAETLRQQLEVAEASLLQLEASRDAELEAVRAEAAAGAAAANAAAAEHAGLQAQLAELRGELEAAQAAVAAMSTTSDEQAGRLHAQLIELQGELEAARAEAQQAVAAREEEVGALRADLDASRAEAQAALLAKQRELQSLEADLEANRAMAETMLDAREEEIQRLRVELAAGAAAGSASHSQAQAQLEELVAEREGWLEELERQRIAARAAGDAAAALEGRLAELSEANAQLAADLAACQEREAKLELEVTNLTGQHNINQRIQYHKKVKDENNALKEELQRLRISHNIISTRFDRAKGELERLRVAAGKPALPDWEEEERLRQSLAVVEAEKIKLAREFEALQQSVVALARSAPVAGPHSPGSSGEDLTGDFVIEFGSPNSAGGSPGGGSLAGAAGTVGELHVLGAEARRALEEIRNRQREVQRSMEDQEQQIRLLKEVSKLQRIRRTSGRQEQQQQ